MSTEISVNGTGPKGVVTLQDLRRFLTYFDSTNHSDAVVQAVVTFGGKAKQLKAVREDGLS